MPSVVLQEDIAGRERSGERGTSLAELMVFLALTGILLAMTTSYAIGWISREDLRHAVSEIRTELQATRTFAISRNRACRFQINTLTRQIQVYDLVDPANNADDILLETKRLPDAVFFQRPDTGSAVTLPLLAGTTYQATFESHGGVSSSVGVVHMRGGDRYGRVTLHAAGGVKIERWMSSAWEVGT